MKIALILTVWKRHDLEKVVIDNFKRQSKLFGFDIIIAGSEGADSKKLAKGCHYIETENKPLSKKHNTLLTKAKELDVDGVVLMGSDDVVCDNYWKWIYTLDSKSTNIIGLKDFYFYSTQDKQLAYWGGYKNGKQVAGAGRFFSRTILDKVNWKLWSDNLDKGLDSDCSKRLKSLGFGERSFTMDEIDSFLVDVKHTVSITNLAIINNCKKVNSSIMAKKVNKETVEKVESLKHKKPKTIDVSNIDDAKMYKFVSNGKCKHLKSKEYTVVGKIAKSFVKSGYGEIAE